MTTEPEPPWWAESHVELSPEICELLSDVDAAFAGAGLSGWPDPHPFGVSPEEDEYSRCSAPMKYAILAARAQAWRQVLLDRGWAHEVPPVRWARHHGQPDDGEIVLMPAPDGAVPLVLATHKPATPDRPFSVTIGAGNPAVDMATIPDCGCDGCDNGSDRLLEEMDTWVLSVVDGSLQVALTAEHYSTRTSFGSSGSTPVQGFEESTAFTAAPWSVDWIARPLVPAPELHRGRGRAARIGDSLAFNLRMMFRRPGSSQRSQVYRAKPWWRL